jgi:hypothetical protein
MVYCKSTSDCDKNQWCNKECQPPPKKWTDDFYKDSVRSLTDVPLSQFNFKQKQENLRIITNEEATCIVDSISKMYNPSEIYKNSQDIIDNIFVDCLHNEKENFEYEPQKQTENSIYYIIIISILISVCIIMLIVNTNSSLKRNNIL